MKAYLPRFFKHYATLLVFTLLVTNCEQEHEVETLAQNNSDFEIRKIDYDEILKIENLKEPFEKIKESLVVEKDIFNRTYYQENDSDKIQIAIDKAIEIKTDGYESYSFKVINPNLEKSSFENLIIERYDDSDFKYFIYTYDTEDNGENSREIVDVKRKEVTANQINLSDFSNLFSYGMAGESCIVDVYVDFDCGCIYIKVISCDNDGGGGSGEGDSDNNDNDNGNNNNTGDSGNNTGGSGGGSGGSGEGGGKNHPIIGVIDDNEDDCNTSKEDLIKVFPNTSTYKLQLIAEAINEYGKDFGIDTKEKLQHFLAQAGHESNNMNNFKENLNYRVNKLGISYWIGYFNPYTDPEADPNKANPNDYASSTSDVYVDHEAFANYVYNDNNRDAPYKLGNTIVGDGFKFRGRGLFQLTGRNNYTEFNTFYQQNYNQNIDLTQTPGLLSSNIEIAVISALWYYKKKVLDKISVDENTTVKAVTKKINGKSNGIKHRIELTEKTKEEIDCN